MSELFSAFKELFNAQALIENLQEWGWIGYIILFAIIFSETGLLIGFCLPGDSLLFVAGFVCSAAMNHALNIWILAPLLIAAAIIGDTVGYWLGHSTGPKIFCREDSIFFHKKHLYQAHAFYERYGGRSIILARFVPIVRTFVPFVAGVGQMDYRRFLQFNIWGGFGWILSMMLLGYWLGGMEIVRKNLEKAVLLVVFLSILPIIVEIARSKMRKEPAPPVGVPLPADAESGSADERR